MRVSSAGKGLRQSSSTKSRFCEHVSTDNDPSSTCRQRIYVICPHCQRSLCLYHINEHQLLVRSLFDSLVNRLNEYQYEFTTKLSIPVDSQILVKNCLDEFHKIIIPYAQRTCCQNDVKQEDVDRMETFLERMKTVKETIQSNPKQSRNSDVGDLCNSSIGQFSSILGGNRSRFQIYKPKTIPKGC